MSDTLMSKRPGIMLDDNPLDLKLAAMCFELSKHECPFITVERPPELFDYLEKVKEEEGQPMPALLMVDLNLPELTGFEVIERIKEDQHFVDIPAIYVLSSSSDPADISQARAAGASDYLVKPTGAEKYISLFNALNLP